MNIVLRTEIVKHVLLNFGLLSGSDIKSIINDSFKLNESLLIQDSDDKNVKSNIYGCKLSADMQEIKVLATQSKLDNSNDYYCLIHLKNTPMYAMYFWENIDDNSISECNIYYSLDGDSWAECSTFLQGTFLAGMEQIKEIGFIWQKIDSYTLQYQSLLNFIQYVTEANEG